jgi:hypothetical protein
LTTVLLWEEEQQELFRVLRRNFTGIDLYPDNVAKAEENISNAIKGKINLKLGEQMVDLSTEKIPSLELYLKSN